MSLFSKLLNRQPRSHSSRRTARRRTTRCLRLEPLEGRSLLAQLAVTTPLDVVDADDGLLSLREAVIEANASPGLDMIHVPAGTYTLSLAGVGEDAALTGDLDLTGRVTIQGAGAGATIIDAAGLDRVFDADESSSVIVSDVTITGGAAPDLSWPDNASGGGIRSFGIVTVSRTTLSANAAGSGGGILCYQGILTVSNSVLADNVAGGGGAIHYVGRSMAVQDTIFSGNDGGAILHVNNNQVIDPKTGLIALDGDSTVSNSTFSNNTWPGAPGGAIYNDGNLRVVSSMFTANSAANGGAVYHDSIGNLTVLNSTFTANSAVLQDDTSIEGEGGAIFFATASPEFVDSELVVRGSTFTGNTADQHGGAIWMAWYPTTALITNSTFTGNVALAGGAIFNIGLVLTVMDSTFTDNYASSDEAGIFWWNLGGGGAIWNGGFLLIRDTNLTGNSAASLGGGIINWGELIVQDSQVIENEAPLGDDIYNLGSLEIIDSVIGEMFP